MSLSVMDVTQHGPDLSKLPLSAQAPAPSEDVVDQLSSRESMRAVERRLVRKLDLTLMPMLWLLYMLKNLDKFNIS